MLDDYLGQILLICAGEFEVSIEDVLSPSRRLELVYCRKAFCIVVKEMLDVKHGIIGRKIGRSINDVSASIINQPDNKYYNSCLRMIRSKVKPYMAD